MQKTTHFSPLPEGLLFPRRENNQRPPYPPKQTTPHCPASAGLSPGPGCSPANTARKRGRTRTALGPANRFAPNPKGPVPGAARTHPHPGRAGVPQPPAQPAGQAQARPQGPSPLTHTAPLSLRDPVPPGESAQNRKNKSHPLTSRPTPRETRHLPQSPRTGRRFYAPFATAGKEVGGGGGARRGRGRAERGGAGRREAAAGTARERLR